MQFLTIALAALSCAYSALALATPRLTTPKASNQLVSRSAGSPHMVIYTDAYVSGSTGLPTADQLSGYNVLILAFLMVNGPQDQVAQWKSLSDSTRSSIKKSYSDAGITLMLSSFGSTDAPTSNGANAATVGAAHAAFVTKYGLDGIDVDYEDMNAINRANGKAEQWLITYTKALRQNLPNGIITHAPVAPWFSPIYTAGAYTKIHKEVGDMIDWYNVQFYNQGDTEYTTCNGLLFQSSHVFPKSSVFEINSVAGVPLNKIVIGKPSAAFQASNGWVDFATLAKCITDAGDKGWDAGTMFWEYGGGKGLSNISRLLKALAAISGHGGGGGVPVHTTSTTSTDTAYTSTPTTTPKKGDHTSTTTTTTTTDSCSDPAEPTSTPGGNDYPVNAGSCSGAKPWDANTVYDGGSDVSKPMYVTYEGSLWANRWWTQGDKPGTDDANPWRNIKSCSSKRADVEGVLAEEQIRNITRAKRNSHNKMRKLHVRRINDIS